jgi:nucleoside-diphosphate-sugar epimerase
MLSDRTVLVTGATGFIGGRLVEKLVLQERARVRVLVRNFSTAARLARFPVEFTFGDVADRAAVTKAVDACDAVFHCAHPADVRRRQAAVAVASTRHVCEAALRSGVRRVVHVSSFAVYGPTPDGDLNESSKWGRTRHPYVRAKRATERLVQRLCRTARLPAVILQPTVVYGPFCRPWTIRPVDDLKTGRVALVHEGTGYCNAVYVDDVVDAMILAATRPDVVGETLLISAAEPVTWRSFWHAFEAALGVEGTVPVSEEEFDAIVRFQTRRNSRVSQLRRLMQDPRVVSRLQRMFPPFAGLVRLLSARLSHDPPGRRDSAGSMRPAGGGNVEDVRPLRVPPQASPELYRSRTRVRIDRARERLGYAPRFDFERGMVLTGQYLRWANLV